MIKVIRSKNIKGNTFNQELTGRDIFVGNNGSGKTTRIQSLAQAMLGYIPGKGKTNQETFKLSSGDEMTAGLQTDDFSFDRSIIRTEKLRGNGSKDIKYTEVLSVSPNKGEKNSTQMNARISSEIGNFPIVFDFQQFLDMSDAKRREFIYGLSPISSEEWDKDKVFKHLEGKLLTLDIKSTSPDLYNASCEIIHDCLLEWPVGYDLSSGLQAMLSWVEAQQKLWNKKEKDATGAVRELAEMKNKLEETDRDIASKKEELSVMRQQHTEVHGQIKAGHEIKRQWEQKKTRLQQLKTEIEQLNIVLHTHSDRNYEAEVLALQKKITKTDISVESEKIQTEVNELRVQKDSKTLELDDVKTKIDRLSSELYTMNTVLKNIKEKGAGICVIHHQISCDKDFSKFTEHVGVNGPKIERQISDLTEIREKIKSDLKTLHESENSLESSRQALYRSVNEESRVNEQLRAEMNHIQRSELAELRSKQDAQSKITMKQEEYDRLLNEKQPTSATLELLEPQLAALANQIEILQSVLEEKEKAKITLSNAQTAMISASHAQYYHTACKNLSEALGAKGIQGELVKDTLGPIKEAINKNLSLMGKHFPVFFSTESETGKEVFQFGWIKDDRHTNFDVLSTGEQLIFLSAFLVTLLERANPPLKVLALDNIENLDKQNLDGVLSGLNALSHKLNNILIAGVIDIDYLDGWKVWNLSPAAQEAVENA